MPLILYTTKQAAKMIGISRQALYDWIERGLIVAPPVAKFGGSTIRMWSKEMIEAAAKMKGTLKRGPKPKKAQGKKEGKKRS